MNAEPLFANHTYPIFEETAPRVRNRSKETTFILGEKPPAHLNSLMWCERRTPRVKRASAVKVNGIKCNEI